MFISFMTAVASTAIIESVMLGSSLAVGVYTTAMTGKGNYMPKNK